jgi:putative addiction module component (TIGR02574 family)
MSSLMTALGIDRLTSAERMQLVEELLDSLDSDRESLPLTEVQRQEIVRRLSALDADLTAVSPWEAVQARVLARLRQ